MLHNYYQHRGGEGVSFTAESEALRALGHDVDTYTLDNATDLPKLNAVQLACRTIWSKESSCTVKKLLGRKPYDILHVQNSFPLLSPSVYDAAKACGVPVVQALRNYRLFCMQTGLFREGEICEECSGKRHSWSGIRHKCYRNNLAASITVSAMLEIHRLRKTWRNRVDAYIAVSGCVKEKYVSNGWDAGKIHVKHNTVFPPPEPGNGEAGNFVVVGRLSEDKGLLLLLDAWGLLLNKCEKDEMPQLCIVGDGPLGSVLCQEIIKRNLTSFVTMSGRLSLNDTYDALGKAVASIQPSVRYEPCSRAIAESYAKGTPVIAAKIGGAVELVEDGVSGFHFPAGDAEALAESVLKFIRNPELGRLMRKKTREKFDGEFAPDTNAKQLLDIYSSVLNTL